MTSFLLILNLKQEVGEPWSKFDIHHQSDSSAFSGLFLFLSPVECNHNVNGYITDTEENF